MANIIINEVSRNYSYNVGTSTFATVALPITASWGPAYQDPEALGVTLDYMLENTVWQHFPSSQEGLESFVSTYRGPASNYRLAKDNSYQLAMTLLTSGYDVLVCRLCPGTMAQGTFIADGGQTLTIKAKYPGTFGNSLMVVLTKVPNRKYWNVITYIVDSTGIKTSAENLSFVMDLADADDSILHIDEIESDFLTFTISDTIPATATFTAQSIMLTGGTDKAETGEAAAMMEDAIELATKRYTDAGYENSAEYIQALTTLKGTTPDVATAESVRYMEWMYTNCINVYSLLKDKLTYNHNFIISPGWDDMNVTEIDGSVPTRFNEISPLHLKLMDCAYYSRCACSLLDIPRSLPRSAVYNESTDEGEEGYAQMLARYMPPNADLDVNSSLYHTHSALFGPWAQYTYVGTSRQAPAPASFLHLLINRAMILNQTVQYYWILPSTRKHNLTIGKPDYNVPKTLLDEWQKLEGVGVNVLTTIPDLGTTIWGNSTLYEVPPATYQALANLSTRYLVNAIEDIVYRAGIAITFRYNNEEAYSSFYAGVTPTLDTMKNAGAIVDYYVRMSADINGLDQVNANSVIGKIYITVPGVINDITIDLIALPPNVDLDQYRV